MTATSSTDFLSLLQGRSEAMGGITKWLLSSCAGSDKPYQSGRKLELDPGLDDFVNFGDSRALMTWGLGSRHVESVFWWGWLGGYMLVSRVTTRTVTKTILVCSLENVRTKANLAERKLHQKHPPLARGPSRGNISLQAWWHSSSLHFHVKVKLRTVLCNVLNMADASEYIDAELDAWKYHFWIDLVVMPFRVVWLPSRTTCHGIQNIVLYKFYTVCLISVVSYNLWFDSNSCHVEYYYGTLVASLRRTRVW